MAAPIRRRVYRKIAYGPLVDVFFLDMRSYRGANGPSVEQGQNLPPSVGFQFFGLVDIDGNTGRLTDCDDNELYKTTLDPVRAA